MKITIDYNNNKIYINPDERYEKSEIEFNKQSMKNTLPFVEKLLEEILNMIDHKGVELESINGDHRHTIGEW